VDIPHVSNVVGKVAILNLKFRDVLLFLLSFTLVYVRGYDEWTQVITRGLIPGLALIAIFKGGTKGIFLGPFVYYFALFTWSILTIVVVSDFGNFLRYTQLFAGIILSYIILYVFIGDLKDITSFSLGFVVGSVFILLDGFLKGEINTSIYTSGELSRASGIADNANTLGSILVLGMFFGTLLYQLRIIHYLLLNAIYLILLVGIVQTASRSSMMGGLFLIIVNVYMNLNRMSLVKRGFVLATLFFLLILGASYISSQYQMFLDNSVLGYRLQRDGSESDDARLALLFFGVDMVFANPFFGVGSGNFTNSNPLGYYSHNDFIEVVSTLGVIGLVLYVMFLRKFYQLIKKVCWVNQTMGRGYYQIGIIFIILFLFQGFFKPLYIDFIFMMVFNLMIVFGLKLSKFKSHESLSHNK
jgi:O-antigen ligase